MEFFLTISIVLFVIYYLFRPTSKSEEENFKSKNENDFQLSFFSDFSQLKFVEIKSFKIEEKKDD